MSEGATSPRAARAHRLRGLYAITPALDDTALLVRQVGAAIAGGAHAVQYRHKSAPDAQRAEQARALAKLCRSHGTLFIVNDDPRLARDVGADGVHVGEDDGELASVREIVGSDTLIGASAYNDLARARALVAGGADYVAFGSLFPSQVKPGARRASLDLVRSARGLSVPLVGIGGIDASNVRSVIDAGAAAVAIITAVFSSNNIEAAARTIAEACDAAANNRNAR